MFVSRVARFSVKCLSSPMETVSEIIKLASKISLPISIFSHNQLGELDSWHHALKIAANCPEIVCSNVLRIIQHHVMQTASSFHSLGDLGNFFISIIKSALSLYYFLLRSWNERPRGEMRKCSLTWSTPLNMVNAQILSHLNYCFAGYRLGLWFYYKSFNIIE